LKPFFALSVICLSVIFSASLSAQNIVLNEVMCANTITKADDDKNFSDWIELYNPGTNKEILNNCWLSDITGVLKWQLPDITLEAHEYLLVFASGRDKREYTNWRTAIKWGDIWKYFLGTEEPDSNWNTSTFSDAGWDEGKSGIGFGDGDDSTEIPVINSLYIRKKFYIPDVTKIKDMKLIVDYDDGFAAYINGIEAARENLGKTGEKITHDKYAYWNKEALLFNGKIPKPYLLKNMLPLLHNGENVLAVQVHNSKSTLETDLTCIPILFLGYENEESLPGAPLEDMFKGTIITQFLHTNFELSSQGEKLYLYDSIMTPLDYIDIPPLYADYSYGRVPDGSDNLFIFSKPTPASVNDNQFTISSDIEPPSFSESAGFYRDSVIVNLTHNDPNVKIFYTVDGSEPLDTSISSNLYTTPIHITKTQVVRARAFKLNSISKNVSTATYLINENTSLPVMSLSANPGNFWGAGGIMSNMTMEWEKPVHVEFFGTDKLRGFSVNAGTRLTGNGSRDFEQKSLAIYFNEKYDENKFNYQIFPDKAIKDFKSIILRNGGNDWLKTLFRDALMHEIAKGTNIDLQAYRPAIVFINGAYWGIYEIREKLNEDYVATNYNIDRDSIYIIKPEYQSGWYYEGRENQVYAELQDYVYRHDLLDSVSYNYVMSQIDPENFIDHNAAEVYYNNYDWPILNNRLWRTIKEGGRWRWILCDTDFGFGYNFFSRPAPEYDDDMMGTLLDSTRFENPPRSARIFRKLIMNEKFRKAFITRFADLLNTNFRSAAVMPIITRFKSAIENEVPRHKSKWARSAKNWYGELDILYEFAEKRVPYVREHLITHFALGGLYNLRVDPPSEGTGTIRVNTVNINNYAWEGVYFKNMDAELTAVPGPGYLFAGWSDEEMGMNNPVRITPGEDITISAKFIKSNIPGSGVVVNEINYNSAPGFDTEDWIELYNTADSSADLSGWIFRDSDDQNTFTLSQGKVIEGHDYLVLCRDTAKFRLNFPHVKNITGNFSFGLNNSGEQIRLFNRQMIVIDSLTYDDVLPWPADADGTGKTLELKNPEWDNSDPSGWAASPMYGTPGRKNSVYTGVNDGSDMVPRNSFLHQNYPNPFNSETRIQFAIAEAGNTELAVFDLLGRQVRLLKNEYMLPGTYTAVFSGGNNSSGLYYLRLKTARHTQVRKMLLLK